LFLIVLRSKPALALSLALVVSPTDNGAMARTEGRYRDILNIQKMKRVNKA
jgi:hypothetical protein